jgi:LysM repeat protein
VRRLKETFRSCSLQNNQNGSLCKPEFGDILPLVRGWRVATIFGVWLLAFASAAPYTVQPKDTLYSISKKFNVPLDVLIRVNRLTSNALRVGQILEIPERQHTVQGGETLFSIAKKYGTTVEALSAVNKLSGNALRLGQVLLIPWEARYFAPNPPTTATPAQKPAVLSSIPPQPASSSTPKPPVLSTPKPPVSSIPKPPTPPATSSSPAKPVVHSTPVSGSAKPIDTPTVKPIQTSWRVEPWLVLPQLPPPERPATTFPSDPNSTKPKNWNILSSAPLPVLAAPAPSEPLPTPPIPVTPPPSVSSGEPVLSYTVQAGDTLFAIAKRFGLTVGLLRQSNNLTSDTLSIGQVLTIAQADAPESKTLRGISERYLGVNYVYGGSSANGLDCSGFTSLVFKELGVVLPRVSAQQFLVGTAVEQADLLEGDLVFFDTLGKGTVSHVGIYLSDGEFIHAASNPGRVLKSKLSEKYYAGRYLGARRVLKNE